MSQPYTIGRLKRRRSDGTSYWSYCIIWWTSEGRIRKTLDTQDKPTAEARARARWANREDGTSRPVDTVGACVTAYLDSLHGERDERRKRDGWKAAKGFWDAIPVAEVDLPMSSAYQLWRGRAVNTMRNELSSLRRVGISLSVIPPLKIIVQDV